LILYHFFNRREYRNDPRFADTLLFILWRMSNIFFVAIKKYLSL